MYILILEGKNMWSFSKKRKNYNFSFIEKEILKTLSDKKVAVSEKE